MSISRRTLIGLIPLYVGIRKSPCLAQLKTITRGDVDRLLDTKDPKGHCREQHDHDKDDFDDWRGSLEWSASDCGHNEGAAAALKLAATNGLSYPELMRGCPESESEIPLVERAIKDPNELDYALRAVPQEKIDRLKDALRQGKPVVDVLVMATDDPEGQEAVGEVWRRRAMMRFASQLAANGKLAPATAIAVASQWHNCQAFRCLLRHTADVASWLRSKPAR